MTADEPLTPAQRALPFRARFLIQATAHATITHQISRAVQVARSQPANSPRPAKPGPCQTAAGQIRSSLPAMVAAQLYPRASALSCSFLFSSQVRALLRQAADLLARTRLPARLGERADVVRCPRPVNGTGRLAGNGYRVRSRPQSRR